LYLSFEKVVWVDIRFDTFTTIIVCGLFYTFNGEVKNERILIYEILNRMEFHEEDNATLVISDEVSNILFKAKYDTNIILN